MLNKTKRRNLWQIIGAVILGGLLLVAIGFTVLALFIPVF